MFRYFCIKEKPIQNLSFQSLLTKLDLKFEIQK